MLNISFSGYVTNQHDRDIELIVTHINSDNVNKSNTYNIKHGHFTVNLGDRDWLSQDGVVKPNDIILFDFNVDGDTNTSDSYYIKITDVKKDMYNLGDITLVETNTPPNIFNAKHNHIDTDGNMDDYTSLGTYLDGNGNPVNLVTDATQSDVNTPIKLDVTTDISLKYTVNNKFDKIHMETAITWSKESYCKRNQVGAVISLKDRSTIPAYNGTISGMDNNCEKECYACHGIGSSYYDKETPCPRCDGAGIVTNDFTLHAEANAITHAAKEGISLDGATIYVTMSPCKECSKLIAQSGIKRVVYKDTYKDTSGLEFLKTIEGVIVEEYDSSDLEGEHSEMLKTKHFDINNYILGIILGINVLDTTIDLNTQYGPTASIRYSEHKTGCAEHIGTLLLNIHELSALCKNYIKENVSVFKVSQYKTTTIVELYKNDSVIYHHAISNMSEIEMLFEICKWLIKNTNKEIK